MTPEQYDTLTYLGSRHITTEADRYVIEVAPGVTVSIEQANFDAWLERRLETRKHHTNRCLRSAGGTAPTRYRAGS